MSAGTHRLPFYVRVERISFLVSDTVYGYIVARDANDVKAREGGEGVLWPCPHPLHPNVVDAKREWPGVIAHAEILRTHPARRRDEVKRVRPRLNRIWPALVVTRCQPRGYG
jgi:hypothetical protein